MKKTIFTLVCLMIMSTVTTNAKTTVIINSHKPNTEFAMMHKTNVKKDAKVEAKHRKEMEKRRKEMEKRRMKAHKEHAKSHKHRSHRHHHHHHHHHR